MRTHIRGGRVIDPANELDTTTDVFLAEGRILAVGDETPEGFAADETIDAAGLLVAPGLVDLQARLREPGQEYKGDIASETRAAIRGGITTLCAPPDTDPPIDTPAVASLLIERAEDVGAARVLPVGALTAGLAGEHLSELVNLHRAGCVAFSNNRYPITNTQVLRRAMEYAATCDLTVLIHAEDPWLAEKGCAHDGEVASRLGLPGIPVSAETVEIARTLALVEQTGVRAHYCKVSSGTGVELIRRARADGLPVTANVSINQLHLTEMEIGDFNTLYHVRPPLRTQRDRDLLRRAVADGTVQAICSDHQPHDADAKLAPFGESAAGISGLETLLGLTLRLVRDRLLDLPTALARITCDPARALGLPGGTLTPGTAADLCLFDPEAEWEVDPSTFASRGQNSPYGHWFLPGRVERTLVDGRTVHRAED
ncbi:dihydroorotase [Thiohalospira halophila DSM 15071]|uniref:Dihydroorotase n=1 Tax=Thiohalospira halophila DSM 15071 TaxID=1123397 RepID=A0A1I1SIZ6_9GAMM|nr:dihydroorotase [Thiohalospira halophila]SFD46282.1 dihydroorotase [Thiohalospira halophila DSM 15071]